jgi:hypothetical protein
MMKTAAIIFLWSAMTCSILSGQSIEMSKGESQSSDPPESVLNQFNKDYPAYNALWSKEGMNYRADFTDPASGLGTLVVYDKNGRAIRTESELQANGYPGGIGDYYSSTLPKGTKYKVYSSRDTSGIQSYYMTSDGRVYYFDKNGNFVRKEDPRRDNSREKAKK